MLIFILVIIGLSVLILSHELGHFVAAKKLGMKVDEFGFGFPPRVLAWRPFDKTYKKPSETEYSINALPFGGFVRIAGESDPALSGETAGQVAQETSVSGEKEPRLFYLQPAWKRAVVTSAGVAVNFVLGWLLISVVLMVGTPRAIVISGVQPGSPAEEAGLISGDVIRGFKGAENFIAFVDNNKGVEITLDVLRDGEGVIVPAVPRTDVPQGEGALGIFLADVGGDGMGFFAAMKEGLIRSFFIITATFAALYHLVLNLFLQGSLLEGVVGPVGIFGVAQSAGGIGLIYLVQVIAIISLNLFVVNLIPFPALDGGRLFLILIEKIKGSPVSKIVEAWANGIGFAFLLTLMVLLTVRDIGGLL